MKIQKTDVQRYKASLKKKGIFLSEKEIITIISNIDSIWSLLIDKYLQTIEKNEY